MKHIIIALLLSLILITTISCSKEKVTSPVYLEIEDKVEEKTEGQVEFEANIPTVEVNLSDPFSISPEDEEEYQKKQAERKAATEEATKAIEANIPTIEVDLSDPFAI